MSRRLPVPDLGAALGMQPLQPGRTPEDAARDEAALKRLFDQVWEEPMMDFGQAIRVLKQGNRVARKGWNGKGMWLALQVPDEHSKMSLPYIYMSTVDGKLVPWLASQTDVLAEDWVLWV